MKNIVLGFLGLLALTSSVWAATFSPTSTSDFPVTGVGISVNTATGVITGGAGNGVITLRSAVIAANANSGSTINIPAGTYTLAVPGDDGNGDPNPAVGDLDVLASVTITGAGPGVTIIQAGTSFDHGIDQILTLNSYFTSKGQSAVLNNFTSRVTGITFRYGTCTNLNTQSGSYAGGAISFDAGYNNGVVYNTGGSMTLSNCVFDSCSAHFGGGAVVTFDGGAVTIDSCVFTNNQGTPSGGAGGSGGAIVFGSTPNPVTNILKNTTFVGNHAGNGSAGAVLYFGGTGANSVGFIHNCVFTNNSADGEAGALDIGGPLTMDQGTLVISNRSSGLGSFDAQGGGVSITGGPTILSNCTIVGNTASLSSADQRGGGGIAVNGGQVTISNCRIFGNVANTGSGLHKDLNPGNVTANNNWWGNNGGPGVGGADSATIGGGGSGGGTLTLTTWLVLSFTASPSTILTGGTSALTASITKNSAAATGFSVPDLTRASFGATLGSDSPAAANLNSGTALSTFTAGAAGGSGNASVSVDAQTLNAPITINQPPVITSANTTTFTVGTAGSFTVTFTGLPTPVVNSSGALPTAVGFTSGTAQIAGTPVAGTGGSYPLVLTATNTAGTNTQSFTLIVNQPVAITNANSTTFTVGNAGSFKIAATGFPVPTLSESNTDVLPGNVTFNATTGILGGTPTPGSGGIHVLHFVAHNGVGTDATQTFTLTVNEAPAVTCPVSILTNATGGVCLLPSVAFAATATGFPVPVIHYQLGVGSIASPTNFPIGTNVVIVTATNSIGTNTCNFAVTVQPGAAPLLSATLVNTNVVLSWPTNCNCYTLQSAPAADSTNWQTLPGARITNNANLFVTNGISTNSFFRLAH